MNFAQALQGLLSGEFVTISCDAWNGKGMHVFCVHQPHFDILEEKVAGPVLAGTDRGDLRGALPCLAMRGADGRVTLGWAPSQRDLFSNDWSGKESVETLERALRIPTITIDAPRAKATLKEVTDAITEKALTDMAQRLMSVDATPKAQDPAEESGELTGLRTPLDRFDLLFLEYSIADQRGEPVKILHAHQALLTFFADLLEHPYNAHRNRSATRAQFRAGLETCIDAPTPDVRRDSLEKLRRLVSEMTPQLAPQRYAYTVQDHREDADEPASSPLQLFTRRLDRYAKLQRKAGREILNAAELSEMGALYRSFLDLVGPSTYSSTE